mmetsp:Transcript_1260/g.3639  ORF Transcript_1260/g.3639 Transcript_1260/m.3639 type:complete len:241 (-) Transcript_1260:267-989(-)
MHLDVRWDSVANFSDELELLLGRHVLASVVQWKVAVPLSAIDDGAIGRRLDPASVAHVLHPGAAIYLPIGPLHASVAVLDSVPVLPVVLLAAGPRVETVAVLHTMLPPSDELLPAWPHIDSETVVLAFQETTRVRCAIGPDHPALSMRFAILPAQRNVTHRVEGACNILYNKACRNAKNKTRHCMIQCGDWWLCRLSAFTVFAVHSGTTRCQRKVWARTIRRRRFSSSTAEFRTRAFDHS